jgi:hypothetical protein
MQGTLKTNTLSQSFFRNKMGITFSSVFKKEPNTLLCDTLRVSKEKENVYHIIMWGKYHQMGYSQCRFSIRQPNQLADKSSLQGLHIHPT